jgi:hypothetical protein
MAVLIGSVLIAAATVAIVKRAPAQVGPDFGYVNPHTWRFEARQGAQATLSFQAPAAQTGATDTGKPPVDAEKGFKVSVTKPGPTGDCVYLRNAINLDLNQERRPMRLVFEARSGEDTPTAAAASAFPITFTVRDARTLLWSDRLEIGPAWQKYERPVKLKQSELLNVVMAMHLGERAGTVQVKNLRVVDGG